MAKNEETIVKYKKWQHKNLSLTVGILQVNNRNRLLEILSTIAVDPDGLDPVSYKVECLSRFVIDYMSILEMTYGVSKNPQDIRSYQESLFAITRKINALLDPSNIFISNSNTLTLLKTDNPLTSCIGWSKKLDVPELTIDPFIVSVAMEKSEGCNYKLHAVQWKTADMTVQIREYSKKDKIDLVFGFEPRNTEQKKLYFVCLCVENISTILNFIESRPETAHIANSQIINDLYAFVAERNQWIQNMKLTEFKKINKEYVGFGQSTSIGEPKASPADSKSYKTLSKVPNKIIQSLGDNIKQEVYGQDHVVEIVANKVRQAYAGLKSPNVPIGVFLFYGGTSTGKTELAKSLARYLMGSQQHLIKIDCNNLQLDHEVALLMGSPPGYVGYEDGGLLAGALSENNFKVILFDEVEKATPKLFDFVLNIIDEGQAYDKRGNLIDFSNTVIIFTSNIGQKEANDAILNNIGFRSESYNRSEESGVQKKEFNKILKKKLKPEFFSRLKIHGGVYYFEGLVMEDLSKVADKYLNQVKDNLLSTNNIDLVLEEGLSKTLTKRVIAVNERAHARDIISAVQGDIVADLTNQILDRGFTGNKNKQTILIRVVEPGYLMEFPTDE